LSLSRVPRESNPQSSEIASLSSQLKMLNN
jgi:hypothetical protein